MKEVKILKFNGKIILKNDYISSISKILNEIELEENENVLIFEESFHFYGLWESNLIFLDNNNIDNINIYYPEDLNVKIQTFQEYTDNRKFKSYKIVIFHNKLIPILDSFKILNIYNEMPIEKSSDNLFCHRTLFSSSQLDDKSRSFLYNNLLQANPVISDLNLNEPIYKHKIIDNVKQSNINEFLFIVKN